MLLQCTIYIKFKICVNRVRRTDSLAVEYASVRYIFEVTGESFSTTGGVGVACRCEFVVDEL